MTIFVVPMFVPRNLTIAGNLVGPRRDGIPSLLGWWGTEKDGEAVSGVVFDWPDRYKPPGDSSEMKRLNERRQMHRLRADLKKGGTDPFNSVRAVATGADPPDFVCEACELGGRVGVELAQLTLEERAESHALFEKSRGRILHGVMESPARYGHLKGDFVAVSFSNKDGTPRKPARTSTELDAVLSALRTYRRPPPPEGKIPEQIDPDQVMKFEWGSLSGVELSGVLSTPFFDLAGFEVALASVSTIRESEAWAEMLARVSKHDKPGVDLLVVIAGSPTNSGVAFPGDMVLVRSVLAGAKRNVVATEHIRRVWIHSWPERVVYELVPGRLGVRLVAGSPVDLG